MSKIKYRVTPLIKDKETLEVITEMNDVLNEKMREISRSVIKLQDQAVREGLIKLGWTPPK